MGKGSCLCVGSSVNTFTGRLGIYNPGRNIALRLVVPLTFNL